MEAHYFGTLVRPRRGTTSSVTRTQKTLVRAQSRTSLSEGRGPWRRRESRKGHNLRRRPRTPLRT